MCWERCRRRYRRWGEEVAVVIPRYGSIDLKTARRIYERLAVHLGPARYDITIYQAAEEFPVYLVDCPPLYDRPRAVRRGRRGLSG